MTDTDSGAIGAIQTATSERADAAGCPHFDNFDPLDHETVLNPYPKLKKARHEVPVFYMPSLDQWCVTRHSDLLDIYRDPISYSNASNWNFLVEIPDSLKPRMADDWVFPLLLGQLNTIDPPQHTRIRKLMQGAFTPKRITERAGLIEEIALRLIYLLPESREADLVAGFSSPLPVTVVSGMLGMPLDTADVWRQWSDDWFALTGATNLPEKEAIERWSRLLDFDELLRTFVEERRREPKDDLASDMIHEKLDDGTPSMSDDEALANIVGVVLAGADTTTILITHVVYMLLTNPDALARVKADRTLIPKAVEETMRLMGPVRGVNRTTTTDVELGGVKIPKGSKLYVHLGSAGRDEDVFDDPNSFNLDRPNVNKHLGFGIWAHFCIGAPLARLEAKIALECLLDRLPDLRLAEAGEELDYIDNMILPSVRAMRVAW
jgi:cytochrome P450